MVFYGFPPVYDGNSSILILGSFPSIKSREVNFYYGNKQNRFWKMLAEFFGDAAETVEDRKKLCLRRGIALWDIVGSCEIEGSMDVDIKNYTLVDLTEIFEHCKITKILCNGAKAYELTLTRYNGDIPVYKMPSTSPANFKFDKNKWFEQLG